MAKKKVQKSIPKMNKPEDTDPQDHMEGPISSLVQDVKEAVEDNDDEKKKMQIRRRTTIADAVLKISWHYHRF